MDPGMLTARMLRQALENMLAAEQWAHIGKHWDSAARDQLNMVWHRLKGMLTLTTGQSDSITERFRLAGYLARLVRLEEEFHYRLAVQWQCPFVGRYGGIPTS